MPSTASRILQACRQASRAARSAASAASRCAALVARADSGGAAAAAAASDPFLRSPSRSHSLGSGRFPIAAQPPWSPGTGIGSTIAAPPTNTKIHRPAPAPGKVKFVAQEEDLESNEALWALYERWCKAFNQERDHDEMDRRFNTFKETVLMVDETDKADLPYKLEINQFADGKLEELRSHKVPFTEFFRRSGDTLFNKERP